MIAKLIGKIDEKSPTHIVLNCNGVGYFINIPTRLSENLPSVGSDYKIPVTLIVREDSLTLYGFADSEEKKLFELLISISGVGPKTALGMLSASEPSQIRDSVISGDTIALSKLPGIGKKTAERIILELREKAFKVLDGSSSPASGVANEAISALTTLGFSRNISEKAVKNALKDIPADKQTAEEVIRLALAFATK